MVRSRTNRISLVVSLGLVLVLCLTMINTPVVTQPLVEPLTMKPEGIITTGPAGNRGELNVPGGRPTNPTAPNELTKYLTGDFTDSDGDGMTDVAENKYGFDPNDPFDFPQEPEVVITSITTPLPESGINAAFTNDTNSITIHWENPPNGNHYLLYLANGGTVLYWGGHPIDYAIVDYATFNLEGTETLTVRFYEYDPNGYWVATYPEFTIDLSLVDVSGSVIGASTNRISYTFVNFAPEDEIKYREFLKRVWPIMYDKLGVPAEKFNCLIKDVGDIGYFMVVNKGREFWTNGNFIPRLIVHEFVHAWKGGYTFTTDENWDYDTPLSGFEEASAEGMAFEIVHEYVRCYPDDSASIQLLTWRPYQYWSACTTYYDSIKFNRWTGAGDFWTPPSGAYPRYSIAATTFQILTKQDPDFYRKMMQEYYERITSDASWRSNREDLLDIWAEIVPYINGIETKLYLDSLPVFQGHKLDEGIYVMNVIYQYGTGGSQELAVTYVINDGRAYWGILKTKIDDYDLPEWVRYDPGSDDYYYIDTQNEPFTVDVFTDNSLVLSIEDRTKYERRPDGTANGFGWKLVEDLEAANFPVGLYREEVTFTNYIQYDEGATEDFYFFGTDGFSQDRTEEYVIMIGVDGVLEGNIAITIDGITYTQPIERGTAIFRSYEWPLDMEGEFPIVVTDSNGKSHTYYRTLLEAGTYWSYYQHQFIIVDTNFNGVEDQFNDDLTPPVITAAFVPIDVDEEGRFRVEFTVTDNIDPDPSVVSVIEIPLPDDLSKWKVKFIVRDELKIMIDWEDKVIIVKALDPEAVWSQLLELGGLPVENGQIINVDLDDEEEWTYKMKKGVLYIEAPEVRLIVIAMDAAGNVSTEIATLVWQDDD